MRRLTILLMFAAVAAGCRTTPPQAYCRPACTPTYTAAPVAPCGCNPCGGMATTGVMATPSMGSPVMETYGAPTIQTGPTVVSPNAGPQSYAPTTN